MRKPSLQTCLDSPEAIAQVFLSEHYTKDQTKTKTERVQTEAMMTVIESFGCKNRQALDPSTAPVHRAAILKTEFLFSAAVSVHT